MEEKLREFLKGNTRNIHGKSIYDIWEYNLEELETDHHYIQWLFPLTKRSRFSIICPVLKNVGYFRIPEIQDNMFRSFLCMLNFYGLEYVDGQVAESIYFEESLRKWCTPKNHNFLRMTRIIRSMRLIGLDEEAKALFMELREIYREKYKVIGKETYLYWKDAAVGEIG